MSTVIEKVEVLSTENSTSATTGSIQTLGGIGVASNVFVGGTTFTNTIAESTLNNGVSVDGVLLKDNSVVVSTSGTVTGTAVPAGVGGSLTIIGGAGGTGHGDVIITTPTLNVGGSQGNIRIIGASTAGSDASNIEIRSGPNSTTSGKIDIFTPVSSSGSGSQMFIGTGVASAPAIAGNEMRLASTGLLAMSSSAGTNITTSDKVFINPAAHIQILGGNHTGTPAASNVLISSGKNTGSGASGNLYMQALTNATNTAGGSIQIKAGNATATTPAITIPNSVNIESTSTNPLSVAVVSTGGVGVKTATTEYSFHVSSSGKLIHTGGAVAPTSITPAAGRIVHVEGGATFTGITDTLGSHYTEAATVPQAAAAGRGTIWVRNDTPNTPMFTDDAGNDRVLWRAPSVMEKIGTTLTTGNTNLVFDQQLLPITGSSSVAAATTVDNFIYQMTAPTNDSAVFSVSANTTIDKDIPHAMSSFSATTKKITAGDAAVFDYFGADVAVDGDWVVVGSPNDDDGGTDTGSAYVYYRHEGGSNMWGQKKKLASNAPVAGNSFGYAVAISGNYIVVASPYTATATGKAEIFFKDQGGVDNWGYVKTITSDIPTANEYFGWDVAIHKDHIVVGAPYANTNTGYVCIYRKDQGGVGFWGLVKKIAGNATNERFGVSVSINGDRTAVGVALRDQISPALAYVGAVVIYDRNIGGANNWGQDIEISSPNPTAGEQFGAAVKIHGDKLIVGSEYARSASGAAWIYEYDGDSGWTFINQLINSDTAGSDAFGYTVNMNDKFACVSASSNNKYLYIFDKDEVSGLWVEITKISPNVITVGDILINAAMDDQHIVWGMPELNTGYALVTRYTPYDVAHTGTESMNINYNTVLRPNDFGQVSFIASVDYTGENLYRNYIPVEKALTSDIQNTTDLFGWAVAVHGDYAVASLKDDDTIAVNAGAVHVYWKYQGGVGNWGRLTTLVTTPAIPSSARFGTSVAIYGDNIIVGSPEETVGAGAVYIFNKDTGGYNNWGQVVRNTASDAAATHKYGTSVSIYGNYAIVGAPFNVSGAAYIHKKDHITPNSWSESKKLLGDGGSGDQFGASVAISYLEYNGSHICVVGAPSDDNLSTNDGAAYIFEEGILPSWGQRGAKRINGLSGGQFGISVAIDGEYIAIGAPFLNASAGQAYVLYKDMDGIDEWGISNTMNGQDSSLSFGQSVSISGKYIAIGHPGYLVDLGVVDVYYNTGVNDEWVFVTQLRASDGRSGGSGDKFGTAVGINGPDIIVGARNRDTVAVDAGGAYMFSVGGRRLNSSLSINKVQ